jgi:hypothetical protein
MIHKQRSIITISSASLLFSLLLILSCAGPESDDLAAKSSFLGSWSIEETRTGGGKRIVGEYILEIKQNNCDFHLVEINNDFSLTCHVNAENELCCGGDIFDTDGHYTYGSDSYVLWFRVENEKDELIGDGDWTYYPQNQGDGDQGYYPLEDEDEDDQPNDPPPNQDDENDEAYSGISVFTATRINPDQ